MVAIGRKMVKTRLNRFFQIFSVFSLLLIRHCSAVARTTTIKHCENRKTDSLIFNENISFKRTRRLCLIHLTELFSNKIPIEWNLLNLLTNYYAEFKKTWQVYASVIANKIMSCFFWQCLQEFSLFEIQ